MLIVNLRVFSRRSAVWKGFDERHILVLEFESQVADLHKRSPKGAKP